MFLAALQIEMIIPECNSLKEKRMVINSIKQRLQNKFNVSVAETDHHDLWQRAVIAVAMVANEKKFLHQAMDKVLVFTEEINKAQIIDHRLEIF